MSKTAACTGGIGDIVYSIPVLHKLNVTLLYVKENFYQPGFGSMYTAVKPLLQSQGIEVFPTTGGLPFGVYEPGLQFDYDIDQFRCRPKRNEVHIIKNMMLHFRCYTPDWNTPFLRNINTSDGKYNLIFLSDRWRENSKVDWTAIWRSMVQYATYPCYFIGLPEDHQKFETSYGPIKWERTNNLLEMAHLIANCHSLYTNQSVALVLAQGLGKNYWLEKKPMKTNTLFYTANEHILL